MKILIEVSGGIVQSVLTDYPKDIEVIIRDLDDLQEDAKDDVITHEERKQLFYAF
jgi:hypothetical protein